MIKTSTKSNINTIYLYLAFFIVFLVVGLVIGYNLKGAYDNVSSSNYIYSIVMNKKSIIQPFRDTVILDIISFILLFFSFFAVNNPLINLLIYSLSNAKFLVVSAIVLFAGGLSGIITFFVYDFILLLICLCYFFIIHVLNSRYYCKTKTIIDKDIRIKYIMNFVILSLSYVLVKLIFIITVGVVLKVLF